MLEHGSGETGPPMENRIRHFRKQRDMTLAELAARVGTTPQSISRLETGLMTLSTDWLQKFAEAFHVHPTDLLEQPDREALPLLGVIGEDARLASRDTGRFRFDIAASDPVAVRLAADIGRFEAGDILICDRLRPDLFDQAADRDCLAAAPDGPPLLARVVAGRSRRYTLVPLVPGLPALSDTALALAAPIIARVTYL